MKVLWLCNLPLPNIAASINGTQINRGGWLVGLSNGLKKYPEIDLSVCFPLAHIKKIIKGRIDNINYYGFPGKIEAYHIYDADAEKHLKNILNDVDPDVVHIFGTEFPHSLAMTRVFENKNKMVISTQGLCSIISKHYASGLPAKVIFQYTLRDFIKQDNIDDQQRKYEKRGIFEAEAIKNVNNIIGRTILDKVCTSQMNPDAKYHFCNEILRDEFYKHTWDINNCQRYSVFASQGEYPVKGLHFVIKALPEVIKRFPQTHLYVAGKDITKCETIKEKLKITSYARYIKQLIDNYKLKEYITFTGNLNEIQMCDRYLKSNVFVMPSSIENSPNSLSEARILGLPCVTSYVGGVTDAVICGSDCFTYQHDAPYMLAHYICEIFSNDKLALDFSHNSRENALRIHNRKENIENLINIYKGLLSEVI